MIVFIDEQRSEYGVEPICKQLPIAVSTYYEHKGRQSDPDREPTRIKQDRWLEGEIQRVWDENLQVYGAKKVWRQLKREGFAVARCTVERLMKQLGLQGAVRGGAKCWTTISDDKLDKPADLVNRQFAASRPNQLWVADITFFYWPLGVVLCMSLLSLIFFHVISWAGGSVVNYVPTSYWMHWSRPSGQEKTPET